MNFDSMPSTLHQVDSEDMSDFAQLESVSGTIERQPILGEEGNTSGDTSSFADAAASAAASSMIKSFGKRLYAGMTIENVKEFGRSAKAQVTQEGFLAPTAFSVPTGKNIIGRVQHNVRSFYKPYALLFGIVAVYSVLTSSWLLFGLMFLFLQYLFLFHVYKNNIVQIGENKLGEHQKTALFTVSALIVFIICGVLTNIISVVFYGSVLSLLHASFHKGSSQLSGKEVSGESGDIMGSMGSMGLEPPMGSDTV